MQPLRAWEKSSWRTVHHIYNYLYSSSIKIISNIRYIVSSFTRFSSVTFLNAYQVNKLWVLALVSNQPSLLIAPVDHLVWFCTSDSLHIQIHHTKHMFINTYWHSSGSCAALHTIALCVFAYNKYLLFLVKAIHLIVLFIASTSDPNYLGKRTNLFCFKYYL